MVNGAREARYAVEMATVIAGSAEELRRRPVMSDLIGTISPLVQDKDGIEAALVFAEAGVPVTFVTMPTLGTTAPATKAGAFAVGAAELVSATVAAAARRSPERRSLTRSCRATPIRAPAASSSFPLDGRYRYLGTELAHHWGVPAESAACGTDSPASGTWQAGVEEALDFVQAAQEGSDLLPSIGLINVYTLFTPEELILGDDIYQRARYAIMDIELDEESLALDTIAEVGPGGHFLGQKHTRTNMRDAVMPAITHQVGPDGAYRDPLDVARERARGLDATTGRCRSKRTRPPSSPGSSRRPTPSCATGRRSLADRGADTALISPACGRAHRPALATRRVAAARLWKAPLEK